MTITIALAIIATLAAVRPFFEMPEAVAKGKALAKAGYKPNAAAGCLRFLLIPVLLGLWWWVALATDLILLGVIPTLGMAATILGFTVEHLAAKK